MGKNPEQDFDVPRGVVKNEEATVRRTVLLMFILLAGIGRASAQRLPHTAVPEHYQLTLAPDFAKFTFTGDETIRIRVLERVSTLTLNAVELEFQDVTVTSRGTTQKARVTADPQREFATLALEKPLELGPAEVHLQFLGKLNDKLRGFYRSEANNRKYAATQFEPTDARRAFPCFDEPALKATFDLSVVIDQGDTAISNGKIISDTPGPGEGKHTVRFSTTAKMSSYLVALAIGNFQCLEGGADGLPIRVCATPEKKELGRFALTSAENIMRSYNKYYGMGYPFGKLDLVALPDFEAGAMENTAAIFSRETGLLLDEKTASVGAYKGVAWTISHEMAHMWFGDLVTMQWWSDLWLNEGFATWISPKPLQDWKPEWNVQTDEAQGASYAMYSDSLQSTRPIHAQAETSAQINELFDSIAYSKTAAVLRMIEAYVGKEVFRAGVNAYLSKHAYDNATAEDFWNALGEVSKKPVSRIMATFVTQPGVPLLSVETKCEGNSTAVTLAQQRYFFDRALLNAGSKELWQVPACLKSGGSEAPRCELLVNQRQTFRLGGCAPWVFANAGALGYYRSAYDSQTLHTMARALETALTPVERISLLGDEWSLVQVGKHNIADYLMVVENLQDERERAVVETYLGSLFTINTYLLNEADRKQFRAWVRERLGPLARELGWKPAANESDERRSFRASVLFALGYLGRDPEVLAQAQALAERYMEEPSSVDPTLASMVVGLAAFSGEQALYEKFLARTKTAQSPEEYYRFLYALTAFSDPRLLQRTLDYALSPDVRNQDTPGLVGSTMGNPAGRELAWAFVKANWTGLQNRLSTFGGAGIVGSTGSFCDAKSRDEVKEFFTEHKVEAAERTLRQTIESINYCIDLRAQQEANLAAWLGQRSPPPGQ